MSRTIREVVVTGKTPDEVQEFLGEWFSLNKFIVKDWYSDGAPFEVRDGWSFLGLKISPNVGSIVAARFDTGWVVFEISLRKEPGGTLFHGEFYVAGWDILKGKEIDLNTENGSLGAVPTRKRGHLFMTILLEHLEDFSEHPLAEK